jgi:hypothetical protein
MNSKRLTLIYRIIPLAGLLPPGSLVVVPGTISHSEHLAMPSLFWTVRDPSEWANPWTDTASIGLSPSNQVISVVSRAAFGMTTLAVPAPALNSSYELTVRGPYLRCDEANATQIPVFEFYKDALAMYRMMTSYTEDQIPQPIPKPNHTVPWQGIVISAFDPFLGNDGWGRGVDDEDMRQWQVDLPANFTTSTGYIPESLKNYTFCNATATRSHCQMFPRQLWINTANNSIVCTLGNATRTAQFEDVNGEQTVRYGDLQDFEPVFVPRNGYLQNSSDPYTHLPVNMQLYTYMAVYQGLANMLIGNVTIVLGNNYQQIYERSNNVLITGLQACDEFSNNYWVQNYPTNKYVFTAPPYMCRNRTLSRAIEDLSANITISMLSNPGLT